MGRLRDLLRASLERLGSLTPGGRPSKLRTEVFISTEQLAIAIAKGRFVTAQHRSTARLHAKDLNKVLKKYNINTPLRIAHFLAQILHESQAFRYNEEIWGPTSAQKRYDTRTDLGNTKEQDGDGYKFRGRGYIQLTGKANYIEYGKAVHKDLTKEPDLVSTPKYAIDVAGWFWKKRRLNVYADADNINSVTRRINGGTNGLSDRRRYLVAAKQALGI